MSPTVTLTWNASKYNVYIYTPPEGHPLPLNQSSHLYFRSRHRSYSMKPGSVRFPYQLFTYISRFLGISSAIFVFIPIAKTDQSASRLVISTSGIYVVWSPISVSAQLLFSASARPFLFSFPSRKLVSLLQGWLFPYQMFTQLHRIFPESVPPFLFSFSPQKTDQCASGQFPYPTFTEQPSHPSLCIWFGLRHDILTPARTLRLH